MVTTVRPKAAETPSRPIPTCGKPAAMTALPQPAKVSQKVPMASARHLRMSMATLLGGEEIWIATCAALDYGDERFQEILIGVTLAPPACWPVARRSLIS